MVSINGISQSYNKTYSESDRLHDSNRLYKWILNKLVDKQRARILDIACGIGLINKNAEQVGLNSFGIDISSEAIDRAKNNAISSKFALANGEALPFSGMSFDYVTNVGSLEHFPNLEVGLSEMHRVLKNQGACAILLPNSYYLFDIIWKVWRTGYPISHRQVIERFATYNQWKDILEKNNFHVIKSYKYNLFFPDTLSDLNYYFHKPKKFLLMLFGWMVPRNLSYHFLYICTKM